MGVTEGIRRHGTGAIAAVIKEYEQLRDLDTLMPLNPNVLSYLQKKESLNLITIIKKKRCGKIKARVCANGRKQRHYIKKEDVASPTVQLESLIATMAVDALERRDVATADFTGAYLKTEMKDFVLVRVDGEATKIMCKVNPEYKNYISTERGRPTLYLRLRKALYGCMQLALLWYETFKNHLQEQGFELQTN